MIIANDNDGGSEAFFDARSVKVIRTSAGYGEDRLQYCIITVQQAGQTKRRFSIQFKYGTNLYRLSFQIQVQPVCSHVV